MFSGSSIDKYMTLTEAEKKALVEILDIVQSGTQEKKDKLQKILGNYPPSVIFKLGESAHEFRQFCQASGSHHSAWESILKEGGGAGENVPSQNGHDAYTTYHQYLGSFLFNEYKEQASKDSVLAQFLLDKSCEQLFLFALIKRCEMHIADLQKTQDIPACVLKVEHDIETLCLYYWTIGCGAASRIYLMLSQYCENSQQEGDAILASHYYGKAAEKFIQAERLSTHDTSKSIIHFLVGDSNLFDYLYHMPFESWDKARDEYIMAFLKNDKSAYEKIQKQMEEASRAPSP